MLLSAVTVVVLLSDVALSLVTVIACVAAVYSVDTVLLLVDTVLSALLVVFCCVLLV